MSKIPLQISVDPLKIEISHLKKREFDRQDDNLRATSMEVVSTLKDLLTMHPLYNEQLRSFANVGGDFAEPDRMADMGASLTSSDEDGFQAILEQLSIPERYLFLYRSSLHYVNPLPSTLVVSLCLVSLRN